MQHVGPQYGQGAVPVSHQTNCVAPESTNNCGSTTSSLRQWRKKDAVEKQSQQQQQLQAAPSTDGSSTDNPSHVARVAPHAHFPSRPNEVFRYPATYAEYNLGYKEPAPVKYSEIVETGSVLQQQHVDLPQQVVQHKQQKEKDYIMDMCGVQQPHLKQYHPEHAKHPYPEGMKPTYNDPTLTPAQYMPKEAQLHQYVQKESQMHQQQFQQYLQHKNYVQQHSQYPRNYHPPEPNNFLATLNKINPRIAQSIINDPHIRDAQVGMYQEQSRAYQQTQRLMHAPPMHSSPNYPSHHISRNMQPYNYPPPPPLPPPSYGYKHNMEPYNRMAPYQQMPKYHHQDYKINSHMEQPSRNISPRRTFTDGIPMPMNYAPMPSKVSPNYNQCSQLEYAQHYQHRRAAQMQQEFYQQNFKNPYMASHQLSAEGTEMRQTASNRIKQFLENWVDEDVSGSLPDIIISNNPGEVEKVQVVKGPVRIKEDGTQLFVLGSTEISHENIAHYLHLQQIDKLGYYENAAVLPESATRYVIENPPEAVLIEENQSNISCVVDKVVNLHIVEQQDATSKLVLQQAEPLVECGAAVALEPNLEPNMDTNENPTVLSAELLNVSSKNMPIIDEAAAESAARDACVVSSTHPDDAPAKENFCGDAPSKESSAEDADKPEIDEEITNMKASERLKRLARNYDAPVVPCVAAQPPQSCAVDLTEPHKGNSSSGSSSSSSSTTSSSSSTIGYGTSSNEINEKVVVDATTTKGTTNNSTGSTNHKIESTLGITVNNIGDQTEKYAAGYVEDVGKTAVGDANRSICDDGRTKGGTVVFTTPGTDKTSCYENKIAGNKGGAAEGVHITAGCSGSTINKQSSTINEGSSTIGNVHRFVPGSTTGLRTNARDDSGRIIDRDSVDVRGTIEYSTNRIINYEDSTAEDLHLISRFGNKTMENPASIKGGAANYKDSTSEYQGSTKGYHSDTALNRDSATEYQGSTEGYRGNTVEVEDQGSTERYQDGTKVYHGNTTQNLNCTTAYHGDATGYLGNTLEVEDQGSTKGYHSNTTQIRDSTTAFHGNSTGYRGNTEEDQDSPKGHEDRTKGYQDSTQRYNNTAQNRDSTIEYHDNTKAYHGTTVEHDSIQGYQGTKVHQDSTKRYDDSTKDYHRSTTEDQVGTFEAAYSTKTVKCQGSTATDLYKIAGNDISTKKSVHANIITNLNDLLTKDYHEITSGTSKITAVSNSSDVMENSDVVENSDVATNSDVTSMNITKCVVGTANADISTLASTIHASKNVPMEISDAIEKVSTVNSNATKSVSMETNNAIRDVCTANSGTIKRIVLERSDDDVEDLSIRSRNDTKTFCMETGKVTTEMIPTENFDANGRFSMKNSDVDEIIFMENSDAMKNISMENSDVMKNISMENSDAIKYNSMENCDATKINFIENSDVMKNISIENSDVTKNISIENSDSINILSTKHNDIVQNVTMPNRDAFNKSRIINSDSVENLSMANSDVNIRQHSNDPKNISVQNNVASKNVSMINIDVIKNLSMENSDTFENFSTSNSDSVENLSMETSRHSENASMKHGGVIENLSKVNREDLEKSISMENSDATVDFVMENCDAPGNKKNLMEENGDKNINVSIEDSSALTRISSMENSGVSMENSDAVYVSSRKNSVCIKNAQMINSVTINERFEDIGDVEKLSIARSDVFKNLVMENSDTITVIDNNMSEATNDDFMENCGVNSMNKSVTCRKVSLENSDATTINYRSIESEKMISMNESGTRKSENGYAIKDISTTNSVAIKSDFMESSDVVENLSMKRADEIGNILMENNAAKNDVLLEHSDFHVSIKNNDVSKNISITNSDSITNNDNDDVINGLSVKISDVIRGNLFDNDAVEIDSIASGDVSMENSDVIKNVSMENSDVVTNVTMENSFAIKDISIKNCGNIRNVFMENSDAIEKITMKNSDAAKNVAIENCDAARNVTMEKSDATKIGAVENSDATKIVSMENSDGTKIIAMEDYYATKNFAMENSDVMVNISMENGDIMKNVAIENSDDMNNFSMENSDVSKNVEEYSDAHTSALMENGDVIRSVSAKTSDVIIKSASTESVFVKSGKHAMEKIAETSNSDVSNNSDTSDDVSAGMSVFANNTAFKSSDAINTMLENSDVYVKTIAMEANSDGDRKNGDAFARNVPSMKNSDAISSDDLINSDILKNSDALKNIDNMKNSDVSKNSDVFENGDVSGYGDVADEGNAPKWFEVAQNCSIASGSVTKYSDVICNDVLKHAKDVEGRRDLTIRAASNDDIIVNYGDVLKNRDVIGNSDVLNNEVLENSDVFKNSDVLKNSDELNNDVLRSSDVKFRDDSNSDAVKNGDVMENNDVSENSDVIVNRESLESSDVCKNGDHKKVAMEMSGATEACDANNFALAQNHALNVDVIRNVKISDVMENIKSSLGTVSGVFEIGRVPNRRDTEKCDVAYSDVKKVSDDVTTVFDDVTTYSDGDVFTVENDKICVTENSDVDNFKINVALKNDDVTLIGDVTGVVTQRSDVIICNRDVDQCSRIDFKSENVACLDNSASRNGASQNADNAQANVETSSNMADVTVTNEDGRHCGYVTNSRCNGGFGEVASKFHPHNEDGAYVDVSAAILAATSNSGRQIKDCPTPDGFETAKDRIAAKNSDIVVRNEETLTSTCGEEIIRASHVTVIQENANYVRRHVPATRINREGRGTQRFEETTTADANEESVTNANLPDTITYSKNEEDIAATKTEDCKDGAYEEENLQVQYRSALKIEDNNVLLHIADELLEIKITVNESGQKIVTVVSLTGATVIDANDFEEISHRHAGFEEARSPLTKVSSNEVVPQSGMAFGDAFHAEALNEETSNEATSYKTALDRKEESVRDTFIDGTLLNQQALNDQYPNEEALNEEHLNVEALNEATLNAKVLNGGDVNSVTLNNNLLKSDARNKENEETTNDETTNEESSSDEDISNTQVALYASALSKESARLRSSEHKHNSSSRPRLSSKEEKRADINDNTIKNLNHNMFLGDDIPNRVLTDDVRRRTKKLHIDNVAFRTKGCTDDITNRTKSDHLLMDGYDPCGLLDNEEIVIGTNVTVAENENDEEVPLNERDQNMPEDTKYAFENTKYIFEDDTKKKPPKTKASRKQYEYEIDSSTRKRKYYHDCAGPIILKRARVVLEKVNVPSTVVLASDYTKNAGGVVRGLKTISDTPAVSLSNKTVDAAVEPTARCSIPKMRIPKKKVSFDETITEIDDKICAKRNDCDILGGAKNISTKSKGTKYTKSKSTNCGIPKLGGTQTNGFIPKVVVGVEPKVGVTIKMGVKSNKKATKKDCTKSGCAKKDSTKYDCIKNESKKLVTRIVKRGGTLAVSTETSRAKYKSCTKRRSKEMFGTTKRESTETFDATKRETLEMFAADKRESMKMFGTDKQGLIETLEATKFGATNQELTEMIGTTKQGSVETFDAIKQGWIDAFGTAKQGSMEIFGTPKQGSMEALGTAKQGSIENLGAIKQGSMKVFGTTKQGSMETLSTTKQGSIETLGTTKQGSMKFLATAKQGSMEALGTIKQEPIKMVVTKRTSVDSLGTKQGFIDRPGTKRGSTETLDNSKLLSPETIDSKGGSTKAAACAKRDAIESEDSTTENDAKPNSRKATANKPNNGAVRVGKTKVCHRTKSNTKRTTSVCAKKTALKKDASRVGENMGGAEQGGVAVTENTGGVEKEGGVAVKKEAGPPNIIAGAAVIDAATNDVARRVYNRPKSVACDVSDATYDGSASECDVNAGITTYDVEASTSDVNIMAASNASGLTARKHKEVVANHKISTVTDDNRVGLSSEVGVSTVNAILGVAQSKTPTTAIAVPESGDDGLFKVTTKDELTPPKSNCDDDAVSAKTKACRDPRMKMNIGRAPLCIDDSAQKRRLSLQEYNSRKRHVSLTEQPFPLPPNETKAIDADQGTGDAINSKCCDSKILGDVSSVTSNISLINDFAAKQDFLIKDDLLVRNDLLVRKDPRVKNDPRMKNDPRVKNDPRTNPRVKSDPRLKNVPQVNPLVKTDPRIRNDPRVANDQGVTQKDLLATNKDPLEIKNDPRVTKDSRVIKNDRRLIKDDPLVESDVLVKNYPLVKSDLAVNNDRVVKNDLLVKNDPCIKNNPHVLTSEAAFHGCNRIVPTAPKTVIKRAGQQQPQRVIDNDEFNIPSQSETSADGRSFLSSDDEIKQCKEEVDLKLKTIEVHIPPRQRTALPSPPALPNVKGGPDHERTIKENDLLMRRFLNRELLTPSEVDKVKEIIKCKRVLEEINKAKMLKQVTKDNLEYKQLSYDLSRGGDVQSARLHGAHVQDRQPHVTQAHLDQTYGAHAHNVTSARNINFKIHLKRIRDGRRKRFRNLYSEDDEDVCAGTTAVAASVDYSVHQSVKSSQETGVPKLIIKRKFSAMQPVVRLERLPSLDMLAKRRRPC